MPGARAYIQDQLLYLQQDKDTTAAACQQVVAIILRVEVAEQAR
jgi:hypothetical protein